MAMRCLPLFFLCISAESNTNGKKQQPEGSVLQIAAAAKAAKAAEEAKAIDEAEAIEEFRAVEMAIIEEQEADNGAADQPGADKAAAEDMDVAAAAALKLQAMASLRTAKARGREPIAADFPESFEAAKVEPLALVETGGVLEAVKAVVPSSFLAAASVTSESSTVLGDHRVLEPLENLEIDSTLEHNEHWDPFEPEEEVDDESNYDHLARPLSEINGGLFNQAVPHADAHKVHRRSVPGSVLETDQRHGGKERETERYGGEDDPASVLEEGEQENDPEGDPENDPETGGGIIGDDFTDGDVDTDTVFEDDDPEEDSNLQMATKAAANARKKSSTNDREDEWEE